MSERTPVLIPAYNEASTIGRALASLPADLVEPLVLVNGSTDATAQIAEDFGAAVMQREAQGKLPIIQSALTQLGSRALEPLLILDADNRPVLPRRWHNGMLAAMQRNEDTGRPIAVGGPVWFVRGGLADDTVKSARRLQRAYQGRAWESSMIPGQCGPNMGFHIRNSETLDHLLELPHYWPGEDIAMVDTVVANGGRYHQLINPALMTINPASQSFPPFLERLRLGHEGSRQRIIAAYVARGAADATPYPGMTNRNNIPEVPNPNSADTI